jgi:hypothetical protein
MQVVRQILICPDPCVQDITTRNVRGRIALAPQRLGILRVRHYTWNSIIGHFCPPELMGWNC